MSRDPNNTSRWVATRRNEDKDIEYLVSHTTWSPDKRFAKVFDAQAGARKYLKEAGLKGTVCRKFVVYTTLVVYHYDLRNLIGIDCR